MHSIKLPKIVLILSCLLYLFAASFFRVAPKLFYVINLEWEIGDLN